MSEWCETCQGRDYAECKSCGWHVLPAGAVKEGLCGDCREKGGVA